MSLHRLHRGLGRLLFLPLLAGQGSERDLDVCARKPERAPKKEKPTVSAYTTTYPVIPGILVNGEDIKGLGS